MLMQLKHFENILVNSNKKQSKTSRLTTRISIKSRKADKGVLYPREHERRTGIVGFCQFYNHFKADFILCSSLFWAV